MKKFLKILLSLSLSVCTVFSLASCGAYGLGSDRGTVKAMNIYFKQTDSEIYDEYLIMTSGNEWLHYETESGNYYFVADEPDVEGYTSSYAVYEYSGKITEKSELPSADTTYGAVYESSVKRFISEDIYKDLGEEVVAANVVVLEGFFFINVFSASHGDQLYKEEIVTSYIGYIDRTNGNITLYGSYNDGRVIVYYNYKYIVYERDNVFYSFGGDVERALFEDEYYERPLQHDNAIKIYYTGAYIYFECVRDCAGYYLITYYVANIDGSHTIKICTCKYSL